MRLNSKMFFFIEKLSELELDVLEHKISLSSFNDVVLSLLCSAHELLENEEILDCEFNAFSFVLASTVTKIRKEIKKEV